MNLQTVITSSVFTQNLNFRKNNADSVNSENISLALKNNLQLFVYQFGTILFPSQHLEGLLLDFVMPSDLSMTTG